MQLSCQLDPIAALLLAFHNAFYCIFGFHNASLLPKQILRQHCCMLLPDAAPLLACFKQHSTG